MKIQQWLLVMALAWIVSPADLAAQDWATVGAGDRVRLSAPESGQRSVVGEVVARGPDTLTVNVWEPIDRQWEVLEVQIGSIQSLEVNRGTRSDAGKGALFGAAIGGAFGLAAGIAAASYDCAPDPWDLDGCWYWGQAEIIPASTVTFALVGAGVGALIGSASRSEIWEPVPADRLRVRVSPTKGGVALAMSVGL